MTFPSDHILELRAFSLVVRVRRLCFAFAKLIASLAKFF